MDSITENSTEYELDYIKLVVEYQGVDANSYINMDNFALTKVGSSSGSSESSIVCRTTTDIATSFPLSDIVSFSYQDGEWQAPEGGFTTAWFEALYTENECIKEKSKMKFEQFSICSLRLNIICSN